ncbi:hypothetical protein CF392_16200 [Tamilnaduibacter salinus]|uniref:Uncharacterized protein n=1 Tax=Tamilnaduibacter salinus TaxID=1484056 RepID=A0A2A2HYW1_9GAMM|nr:hypothetical protein CF392_16200 [Tamilnaduibacter salinus]
MKRQVPVKPGYFIRGGREFIALSEIPRATWFSSSDITTAVSIGELSVTVINGCKATSLGELFRFMDSIKREACR